MRDGFRTRVLDLESILLSYELRQAQGDPFDRLLHAQAVQPGCRLMTLNRALPSFGTSVFKPQQTEMTFAYPAIGKQPCQQSLLHKSHKAAPNHHTSHTKTWLRRSPLGQSFQAPRFHSGGGNLVVLSSR